MIGKLKGIVSDTHSPIIIDVHDVGYLVHITDTLAQKLKPNEIFTFYVHTHIREDAMDLYGFVDKKELSIFKLLLSVSGIGPKTALAIVGHGAPAVERAVQKSNVDFFTTIPRLGRKNAQKIIIELKNKLGGLTDIDLSADDETKQIIEALLSMGYKRNDIIEALKKIKTDGLTIEEKIKQVIKRI